jgi:Leucine-rich repeat (LRR) protein
VSALAGLNALSSLYLSDNAVRDLSALVSLAQLSDLSLENNQIADLTDLAQGSAPAGGALLLRGNPLDCNAERANIERLRTRMSSLMTDCP